MSSVLTVAPLPRLPLLGRRGEVPTNSSDFIESAPAFHTKDRD